MERYLKIMKILFDKDSWCSAQTSKTLIDTVKEESNEVLNAIGTGDTENLKEELGDLLWQVVALSLVNEKEGNFSFEDVVTGITEKMIKRHDDIFHSDGTVREDIVKISAEESHQRYKRRKVILKEQSGGLRQ